MTTTIESYRWTDGKTRVDDILNPTFRDLDLRIDDQELRNTFRFFIPGVLAVANILRFPWPFASRRLSMGLAVNTAPTGAAILAQLAVGGVDVFLAGERPAIAAAAQFGTYSVIGSNLQAFSEDAQAILQIDQIGSGVAGSDLTAIFRSEKT